MLAALVVGWWLTPASQGRDESAWQSTLTVVPAPGSEDSVKLDVVRTFATSEQVTADAAKRLGLKDPAVLKPRVDISADAEAGMITITATGATQHDSEAVAGAFAKAMVQGYRKSLRDSAMTSADERSKQLKSLGDDITSMQDDLNASLGSRRTQIKAQLDSLNGQYSDLYSTIAKLRQTARAPVLEQFGGINSTASSGSVLSAPSSRSARLALAAALGLALGLVAVLMLDRLDTRLRSRSQAEEAFGFPVIGEIPVMSRRLRRSRVPAVASSPGAPAAEAYRALRAALLLTAPSSLAFPIGGRRDDRSSLPRLPQTAPVVLVVSARPGDGRTTTVAELAAALAETGRSVLVLDCDFRGSRAHELLGVEPGPGMAELLGGDGAEGLKEAIRPTRVERVGLVTAGRHSGYPAALVVRADEVLDEARKHADVVLVDSSPLLYANDSYDLVGHADTVLLTARSSHVTPEQAGRVGELLARTSVPVAGIALTASPGSPGSSPWITRRPSETVTTGAVTPFPAMGPGLVRDQDRSRAQPPRQTAEADPPDRGGPSWALGRDGTAPKAEGDDL
ncbi:hypothetical protein GCM10012280_55140 [Wenjunlia tyrosinilytica]|uniref:Uncharacterized protein n=1 Tax=Wenjunlia tyrosinilytica TaxID=1544741 RepID=A0A917ZVG1_9ACTN|nr:hypothetical protein GCM10012280_55140 [Wenjunlia tyrosinilytica]